MSNSEIIKKAYKELLADYKPHTRQELFEYARKKSRQIFTEGMLTGALKTLVDNESEYICVSRAVYQKKDDRVKATEYMKGLILQYRTMLQKNVESLKFDIKVDPFEIIESNDIDRKHMKEIQNCIEYMELTIEKLKD